MAASEESSVQVVGVARDAEKGPAFEVLEENLKNILNQNQVKDLPVVVMSIAGKYREGKSFFMNLVEGYLRNKGSANWLSPENFTTDCFRWQPGTRGCTSGLWMCNKPFIVSGPNGEKVALLLMDSQGTFDTTAVMKECSTMFALSTLLSNVQIYNLKDKFSRDDLEALQLFVDYGKAAHGQDNKPFKALQFLIRDWCDDEFPYGAAGGKRFVENQQALQQDQGINILGDISCGFETVDCCLMPMPWNNYESRKNRAEAITDLSDSFKEQIESLLDNMFSWDNVKSLVKEDMSGFKITTKEILNYIKAYVDIFNGDSLAVPKSAFEANVEISLAKTLDMSLREYDDFITSELGIQGVDAPSRPMDALNVVLEMAKQKAVDYFQNTVKSIKNIKLISGFRAKLEQDINIRKLSLVNDNCAKRSKEEQTKLKEDAERIRIQLGRKIEEIEMKSKREKIEMENMRKEEERMKIELQERLDQMESQRIEEMENNATMFDEMANERREMEVKNNIEKGKLLDKIQKNRDELEKQHKKEQDELKKEAENLKRIMDERIGEIERKRQEEMDENAKVIHDLKLSRKEMEEKSKKDGDKFLQDMKEYREQQKIISEQERERFQRDTDKIKKETDNKIREIEKKSEDEAKVNEKLMSDAINKLKKTFKENEEEKDKIIQKLMQNQRDLETKMSESERERQRAARANNNPRPSGGSFGGINLDIQIPGGKGGNNRNDPTTQQPGPYFPVPYPGQVFYPPNQQPNTICPVPYYDQYNYYSPPDQQPNAICPLPYYDQYNYYCPPDQQPNNDCKIA